ncbi:MULTISPECIES: class F sortase [unclassified Microbacterium]|uniref:class F sortase n=1 Tax=unclassified Microbacterium TaxID=2609290 RepID=UPI00068AB2C2|nr:MULTISPECIES: class F sortase [unclassified Microbacterium]
MNIPTVSPTPGDADTASVRRERRLPFVWIAGAAVLIVVAAALTFLFGAGEEPSAPAESTRDMAGNAVVLEDPIQTPQSLALMNVVEDLGERFAVPSVGLDVPLGGLDMVDGEITPPGFTSAYTVRNLGVPDDPSAGTTYVVMHSIPAPGVAPGNYLIDVADGRAAVPAGAQVLVGEKVYAVDSSYSVDKGELSAQSALWADRPGRLVIITCQQLPSGARSVQNTVIEAHLVAS